jgi:hypothetical protein
VRRRRNDRTKPHRTRHAHSTDALPHWQLRRKIVCLPGRGSSHLHNIYLQVSVRVHFKAPSYLLQRPSRVSGLGLSWGPTYCVEEQCSRDYTELVMITPTQGSEPRYPSPSVGAYASLARWKQFAAGRQCPEELPINRAIHRALPPLQ